MFTTLVELRGAAHEQRGIASVDGMTGDMATFFAELPGGVSVQHLANDLLVLARVHAAGGIDHSPTQRNSIQCRSQQTHLDRNQFPQLAGHKPPAYFGTLAENAGVRTGDIDQCGMEWPVGCP